MNWNKNSYHDNEFMTEELYNFWFNQEVKYLLHLSNKKYIPEILYLDTKKRMIEFRWYDKMDSQWDISENSAVKILDSFLESSIYNYKKGRDFPASNDTSKLSPYIRFGLISVNKIWYALDLSLIHI